MLPELFLAAAGDTATTTSMADHTWAIVKILLMILVGMGLLFWWLKRQA